MAEWESSYGGRLLVNARFLTEEDIKNRYPISNNSFVAKLTREFFLKGFDILYGERPDTNTSSEEYYWTEDVLRTAAKLYKTTPERILLGPFTDLSKKNAVYAAVKEK